MTNTTKCADCNVPLTEVVTTEACCPQCKAKREQLREQLREIQPGKPEYLKS